jgi:hypothetical protein
MITFLFLGLTFELNVLLLFTYIKIETEGYQNQDKSAPFVAMTF